MTKAIKYFEYAFLGSIGISLILFAMSYQHAVISSMWLGGNVPLLQAIVIGITLLLVLMTSRKKNTIAKWLVMFLTVLSLPVYFNHMAMLSQYQMGFLLTSMQMIAQVVGVLFLLTKESREWLESA